MNSILKFQNYVRPRCFQGEKLFFKTLGLILAAAALCIFHVPAMAEGEGPILTGKVNTTVTRGRHFPFTAIVDEVLVHPGQAVEEGAPLLRYHLQEDAERNLRREMTTGSNTEGLKGQILTMERELASIVAERNKTRQLVASGLGSKQALSRLENNVTSLQNRIALTKETLRKTEDNYKLRLKELSKYFGQPIKEGQELPKELVLTSPIKGFVLSIEPSVNPGQLLNAGMTPVQIGQMDPVIIRVPVYETDLNTIKIGDPVSVEIPSLNNRVFEGKVTEISWNSTDMNVSNPSYYMVELTVPNPDLLMKPGFKAVARFHGRKS